MSTPKGKTQVNIVLSETMNQQLAILAEKEEHPSKSAVVEKALLQLIEGGSDSTVVLSMHDHVANMESRLLDAIHTLQSAIQILTDTVQTMHTDHDNLIERLKRSEQNAEKKHDSLLRAYDSLRDGLSTQPTSLKRLFGMG